MTEDKTAEPDLSAEVVDEGTRIVEELLRTWASHVSEQDGDIIMADADDSSENQLEELKKCVDQFRPRIESNAWVQHVLASL